MNKFILYIGAAFFVAVFTAGCNNEMQQQQALNEDSIKERMINVNKTMVDNEAARIADFIRRHGWTMDSTRTGLRYWIYKQGSGIAPKATDRVKITYKLFLLDGNLVDESASVKPLELTMGRGEATTGLEEALQLMQPGSKAWLVVPKYLGYGMTGDGNKVPGNSTLLYDVELKEVIN